MRKQAPRSPPRGGVWPLGRSIINGDAILTDLNAQMPQIEYDTRQLAQLVETYADASPDLWSALENAAITGDTLNEQRTNLDSALMASIGFADNGANALEHSAPYIVRGADDMIPTSQLLDVRRPALSCKIRNYHDVEPKYAAAGGGNGYSGTTTTTLVGAGNPYVYPDNLPRVNAHGGPEGRPGNPSPAICGQRRIW
jgi:phospholipid/cholesterol/gamma-HCH transport system substrate-binding protein